VLVFVQLVAIEVLEAGELLVVVVALVVVRIVEVARVLVLRGPDRPYIALGHEDYFREARTSARLFLLVARGWVRACRRAFSRYSVRAAMTLGDLLAYAALVSAAPLAVGILAYVGGSFAMMGAHVERRPVALALRAALREMFWAAVTQPLLPLFYFAGRRLAPGGATPVVVVHGYTQNRVDFLRLASELSRSGLGPVYGFNYPWFSSVHANALRLARFVDDVRRETGADRVDLVAHSLGGLVALEYVHDGGAARVRRLVTVASPHGGVPWRGPILGAVGEQMRHGGAFLVERASRAVPVPTLSIYSTHDNVVHPPATSALARRGGRDQAVGHVAHLAILFEPAVARAVVDFLGAPASGEALQPAGELLGA
jgi:pimeloyl-ACP methyl ester carboxylesterase